jgi:hypothetical protein
MRAYSACCRYGVYYMHVCKECMLEVTERYLVKGLTLSELGRHDEGI